MNTDSAKIRWEVINHYIPPGTIGAEIGVFHGHFSEQILQQQVRKLYLVDPWYKLNNEWDWKSLKQEERSTLDALKGVEAKLASYIESGIVEIVIEYGNIFLDNITSSSLDFVYIDSSHNYTDTVLELNAAYNAVNDTGIILGDDWHTNINHKHYGVTKAINELINCGKFELVFKDIQSRQWGIKKVI
jgi:hypothetical protein